jgi:tryptophanyl-tRNA synthetase
MNAELAAIRERAAEIRQKASFVDDVLADGADRARKVARETLQEVKERMGLATESIPTRS